MNKSSRALFGALQKKRGVEDVRPLITPETAKTPDNFYQLKPLFWALSYGASAEVLRLLLAAYPEAAKEVHPTEGWTPLHYAERLDAESVKFLLETCPGASAVQDSNGSLPLHWAAEHAAPPQVVKLLLQANKEAANTEDARGRVPVRIASEAGASDELQALFLDTNSRRATGPAVPLEDQLPVGLIFPGQGAQYTGMLETVKDVPYVKEMLREASSILGYDLLQVCLEGPEEKLQQGIYCQPALYVAGLAGLQRLKEEMPENAERCQAMAGLSLGEYTALTAAGVFSFSDGLRLIKARAEAMEEAGNVCPQAMMSVAGIDEGRLGKIIAKAVAETGENEVCQIATRLFQRGFLIGGSAAAVERCKLLCDKAKAQQTRLMSKNLGFHTSLMTPARSRLEEALREVAPRMASPRCKVYMSMGPTAIDWDTDPKTIVELLLSQLTQCISWKEGMLMMAKDGVEEFFECGPGKQLKAMMKRIDTDMWGKTTCFEV